MSKGTLAFLMSLGGVVLVTLYVVFSYFHYANTAVSFESLLKGVKENNKNVSAGYTTKVVEMTRVAKLGITAQQELIKIANQSRYGESGASAVTQFITEQNPNADIKMLQNVQDVVNSGRTDFQNEQKKMLDVKTQYTRLLEQPYSKFWLAQAGYPKINLDDFKPIINDYTEKAYQTGKAEALNFE